MCNEALGWAIAFAVSTGWAVGATVAAGVALWNLWRDAIDHKPPSIW